MKLAQTQPWSWKTKKISLDIATLEHFYANPANAAKLFKPTDRTGEQNVHLPRMLALPPQFVPMCTAKPITPFAFHQRVTTFATAPDARVTLADCQFTLDWCILASHQDSTPLTSVLAFAFEAAISGDVTFNRWLQRRLLSTLGPVDDRHTTTPANGTFLPPPGPPPPPPDGWHQPPPDMWNQFTANLTQGLANVAAAIQPAIAAGSTRDGPASYDDGGKNYDAFQLAVIQGFSHSPGLQGIQQIWALFQHTKHLDTHKDNIKKRRFGWAEAQRRHVTIDRGIFLPNTTLREILSLKFTPGNTTAELSTADHGLSILICRARSVETKSAIRRRELAEDMSKNNRSLADAERTMERTDTSGCPEDYNELLRCLGTYCALLHTLFGPHCEFFTHCLRLWKTMDSEHVYDRRQYFTPLFCRQVIWAIIEDGRSYFSARMSPDDFIGIPPTEIAYPESTLLEIEPHIRHQTPIVRSSFPIQWLGGQKAHQGTERHGHDGQSLLPPVATISAGSSLPTPSVFSALTTGSAAGTAASTQQHKPQMRSTNVHQTIRTAMSAYVQKFRSIRLLQMLSSLNLTLDDLPTLPNADGTPAPLCYN